MSILGYASLFVVLLMMMQFYFLGTSRLLNIFMVGGGLAWLFIFSELSPFTHAIYSVFALLCFVGLMLILLPLFYGLLRFESLSRENILDAIILALGIFAACIFIYEKAAYLLLFWG